MKSRLTLLFIFSALLSCSDERELIPAIRFEFISEYSATVTVGGVVGIVKKTFEVGEIYEGYYTEEKGMIKLRIARHTTLNKDCPNSWCYQEFLEVPSIYLNALE